MRRIRPASIMPRLNAELDALKGQGTDTDLANTLACSTRTLVRIRNGEHPPSPEILIAYPQLGVAYRDDLLAYELLTTVDERRIADVTEPHEA